TSRVSSARGAGSRGAVSTATWAVCARRRARRLRTAAGAAAACDELSSSCATAEETSEVAAVACVVDAVRRRLARRVRAGSTSVRAAGKSDLSVAVKLGALGHLRLRATKVTIG